MNALDILPGYRSWIAKDNVRSISNEVDFGFYWTPNGNENVFPRWRVSWIVNTGELYAVQVAKDRYILLDVVRERTEVDKLMEGWAESGSPIYHNLRSLARRIEALEPVNA